MSLQRETSAKAATGTPLLHPYIAYIGIGSNLDAERQVARAVDHLARRTRILAISTFYRSPAAGGVAAPWFCNGVVAVETWVPPRWFVAGILKPMERRLGRHRIAPRNTRVPIDLDLLLAPVDHPNGREDHLHDTVLTEAYAAVPLLEVAGDVPLSGSDKTLGQIASGLAGQEMTPLGRLSRWLRQRHLACEVTE